MIKCKVCGCKLKSVILISADGDFVCSERCKDRYYGLVKILSVECVVGDSSRATQEQRHSTQVVS